MAAKWTPRRPDYKEAKGTTSAWVEATAIEGRTYLSISIDPEVIAKIAEENPSANGKVVIRLFENKPFPTTQAPAPVQPQQ